MLLAWGAVLVLVLGASGLIFASGARGAGPSGEGGTAQPRVSGGNSLQELAETPEESTATTSTTSTAANSSTSTTSNSQKTILIAIAAAVILLSGIAFVIARDARRVAPATDADLAEARSGSRDPAVVLRKRRARAKAARQQRKRNR